MALSMVHLLVARRWAREREDLFSSAQFYLGAISPDAMHVRFHDDKSHKDEFHLGNWLSVHPEGVYAYWQEHHTPFDLGYGIHALTDGHWVPTVKRDFPDMVNERGALIPALYYNDAYQTDFDLYRLWPQRRAVFALLAAADAPADHPLLTQEEISAWREQQFSFYEKPCPYAAPVTRVTVEYALRFVEDLVPRLDEIIRRFFA